MPNNCGADCSYLALQNQACSSYWRKKEILKPNEHRFGYSQAVNSHGLLKRGRGSGFHTRHLGSSHSSLTGLFHENADLHLKVVDHFG